MEKFIAAVVQTNSTGRIRENMVRVVQLVRQAADSGAHLVALPENFAWIRVPEADPPPVYSISENPIVKELTDLAKECKCYLLLGGFPERSSSESHYYNSSLLLAPDGEQLAHYRKRHLFDVDLPDGTALRESDFVRAGTEIKCAQTPLGSIGLSICYDLRFPEHYRDLVDGGAEILTAPAAFTKTTGQAHWHLLVKARAVENQCFMIAPNQVGHHGGNRDSFGHSLIVDPWGEILAEVEGAEGVGLAELDPKRLETVRQNLPALKHRVPR